MAKINPRIILDFDGPINDVSDRYFSVHQDVCDRLGLSCNLSKLEFWTLKRRQTPLKGLLRIQSEAQLDDYASLWLELIEHERYLALDRPHDGVTGVLERLSEKFQLVLVSLRSNHDAAVRQLESYQINNFFEHICFLHHHSQQTSVKFEAIRKLFASSKDIQMFVGDTEIDLLAARRLNVKFVGVGSGIRTPKKLFELGAELVLPDLVALEGLIKNANN